jgi:hypothetical protein
MTPRQKCHKLWHYFRIGPGLGQTPHILQVPGTVLFDSRKLVLEVGAQPVDHPSTPAFGLLADQDLPSDRPVEQDQLPAHGKGSPQLSGTNAVGEFGEQLGIAGWRLEAIFHQFRLAQTLATTSDIIGGHLEYESMCELRQDLINKYRKRPSDTCSTSPSEIGNNSGTYLCS